MKIYFFSETTAPSGTNKMESTEDFKSNEIGRNDIVSIPADENGLRIMTNLAFRTTNRNTNRNFPMINLHSGEPNQMQAVAEKVANWQKLFDQTPFVFAKTEEEIMMARKLSDLFRVEE